MKAESRGFRYGVSEVVCESSEISLLDLVNELGVGESLSGLELIEFGAVYVNDVRQMNPSLKLSVGDRLRVHKSPRRFRPIFAARLSKKARTGSSQISRRFFRSSRRSITFAKIWSSP